jgi:hypothetical protein
MDFVPTVGNVVFKLASPPASAAVPRFALPLLNVTMPVGVPDEEETVAVKLTDCPTVEGFSDEVSAMGVIFPLYTSLYPGLLANHSGSMLTTESALVEYLPLPA